MSVVVWRGCHARPENGQLTSRSCGLFGGTTGRLRVWGKGGVGVTCRSIQASGHTSGCLVPPSGPSSPTLRSRSTSGAPARPARWLTSRPGPWPFFGWQRRIRLFAAVNRESSRGIFWLLRRAHHVQGVERLVPRVRPSFQSARVHQFLERYQITFFRPLLCTGARKIP